MIDFKHHMDLLNESLKINDKLLKSSESKLNELQSKILQNKDKFSAEQLEAYEKAMKEAEEMRNKLKSM